MKIDDNMLEKLKNVDPKSMEKAIKMAGQLFGIDPEKAKSALSDPEKIKKAASSISENDINTISDLLKRKGINKDEDPEDN